MRKIEADTCDGCRRVVADTRELAYVFVGGRETAGIRHLLRGFLKSAPPIGVAEPGPGGKQILLGSGGERVDVRESLEEALIKRNHRCNPGLLQHDFRDPDPVRITGPTPWKVTFADG